MPSEVEDRMPGWLFDKLVLPDARLQQGDLIRFEGEKNVLRKLAIVVTADCDLEQHKHGRTLTLVPVVEVSAILENYLLPDDCEKKRSLIERFVFAILKIDHTQDGATKYALLKEAASGNLPEQSKSFRDACDFLLGAKDCITFSDYNALMSEMKIPPRKIDSLKSQMRSRGDLFVLPESNELGIKGHIAWVRQLWQTPTSSVAIRTSEVSTRPGERLARLDSPYRYRLTQLIAQVFSDIGLPNFPDSIDQILQEKYQ